MGQGIATTQFYLYGRKHFTQTGYLKHVKEYPRGQKTLDHLDARGKVYVVTGANSGTGFEVSKALAKQGAKVYMLCRNRQRAEAARQSIVDESQGGDVRVVIGDCGLQSDVRMAAAEVLSNESVLHGVVCNAGALYNERQNTSEGVEATLALHLLYGSYLLSSLLLPALRAGAVSGRGSAVVFVASGGMYNTKFPKWKVAAGLEGSYFGQMQYCYAKRGQVLLAERWAKQYPELSVVSAHPGWADTPAVEETYGAGKKVLEPLRTPYQGAEGIAWLCMAPKAEITSGAFYLDREPQVKHLAGPYFSEGSATKNTTREVDEMIRRLEEWSTAPKPSR